MHLRFLLWLGLQGSIVAGRAGRWGWQRGSSLSTRILLHIAALGDRRNSEDVTIEATTCRTQRCGTIYETYVLWTAKYYRVKAFFPDRSLSGVQPKALYPACPQCLSLSLSQVPTVIHFRFFCRICFPFSTCCMFLFSHLKSFSLKICWVLFQVQAEPQA